ncbi:hypothetical protein BC939DRAFT_96186 [Gamsiella multidivaricata]|uniref:uncharacterized protein n=1 Tax=Gamsiella multidivaricata TaxID=101098 RepID=UPI00221F59E5|nr:uncharacterized protein BC939DRAFT_96186 [Gamsiella multidivaricata]KAI7827163.1 hypothetical protein BC939DRAFT_96186 [Gamsiella multidivaricata]
MVHVPSFFFILAVSVLAFAHSLLHLTQTNYQSICPTPSNGNYSESCTEAKPAFPSQYFDAVTTTYFFIVGKYDAVTDSMGQGQAAVQIMVALFVFPTAILMLNVVIGKCFHSISSVFYLIVKYPFLTLRNACFFP